LVRRIMARGEIKSPFVRREELEGLREEVEAWANAAGEAFANIEARLSVIERALESVIEDLEILTGVAEPEPEEEPADTPNEGVDTESNDGYGAEDVSPREAEETPEEEAARLRREAADRFVRENEAGAAETVSDFNDIADVPEEGRDV
jgi:hypothetical protein